MSAEIIQFMPCPSHTRKPARFPRRALCSAAKPSDPVVDATDTSPCEYVVPDCSEAPLPDA